MMVLLDSFQIFFGFQPFSCHCAPLNYPLVMPTYLAAQEKKKRHIRQKMEFQLLASYNSVLIQLRRG